MNILLATDASLERGGITLFMLQWIRGIREIDKDGIITVYFKEYIENQEIAKEYEDLGVTIITGDIPGIIKLKSPKARKKIKGDIRKILSEKHYDAVAARIKASLKTAAAEREKRKYTLLFIGKIVAVDINACLAVNTQLLGIIYAVLVYLDYLYLSFIKLISQINNIHATDPLFINVAASLFSKPFRFAAVQMCRRFREPLIKSRPSD